MVRSLNETRVINSSSAGACVIKGSSLGFSLVLVVGIGERGASAVADADLVGIEPLARDGME